MAKRAAKPEIAREALSASAGFREALRYEKAGTVRIYNLRVVSTGTELWVVSSKSGRVSEPKKRMTIENPDEVPVVLEDVERTLRMGGWCSTSSRINRRGAPE